MAFQIRGPYAILPNLRLIQLIFDGDRRTTKENLRVKPRSFQRLVRIIPYEKRSGWQKDFEVLISTLLFPFECFFTFSSEKVLDLCQI